jgi:hypothetical protein
MGKKKSSTIQIWIVSIVFVFSTFVLFVNNLTQLLVSYDFPINISVASWIGIMVSILWWMYLFIRGNIK